MEYVIGADIGTGSVKAVAVDLKGKAFETAQHHYLYSVPLPGYHEQDPARIWEAFKETVKELVDNVGHMPLAISLSSAMHSLIAVDEIGVELYPMITWADSRASEIAQRLKESPAGTDIYKATGTPLHAMSPLAKLIWIKENNPALFRNTAKFISIKEYIWYRLFGEFSVDHSIASCTGLFNIENLSWHEASLSLAGISSEQLSTPVPTNHVSIYKSLDSKEPGFLSDGVPFIIGASDGCLANLGSMGNKPGTAVMTIGTSGAVRISSPKPLLSESAMTFSYILDQETFVCGGPINNGGIALQWWLKNQTHSDPEERDYDALFSDASSIPVGSRGLVFLPYLTGERAPIWDSESCGVFFGLKLAHDQACFSRSVLEGICYAMKHVLEGLENNAGLISQISVGGGVVKSEMWLQLLADVTGKRLIVAQTEDASAVGAAFLGMKTLSLIIDYPDYDFSMLKTVEPIADNAELYKKYFVIYKKLYHDLKATMRQLDILST